MRDKNIRPIVFEFVKFAQEFASSHIVLNASLSPSKLERAITKLAAAYIKENHPTLYTSKRDLWDCAQDYGAVVCELYAEEYSKHTNPSSITLGDTAFVCSLPIENRDDLFCLNIVRATNYFQEGEFKSIVNLLTALSTDVELTKDVLTLAVTGHEVGHMATYGLNLHKTKYEEPICDTFGLQLVDSFMQRRGTAEAMYAISCGNVLYQILRDKIPSEAYQFCNSVGRKRAEHAELLRVKTGGLAPIPLATACAAFVKEAIDNEQATTEDFTRVLDVAIHEIEESPHRNYKLEKLRVATLDAIAA